MTKASLVVIEITGCDPEKVKRASKSKKLLSFPFSLSAKPNEEWADAFERVWESSRKKSPARKTRARVRKGEILLECSLTDVKLVFAEVKQSVDEANKRYAEELQEKAEKSAKRKQKEEADRQTLLGAVREALDGIDYSLDSATVAAAKPKKPKPEKLLSPAES
ncbi:MAG: hypothetical protein AABO41_27295 [Acidobacteriota bacterium]